MDIAVLSKGRFEPLADAKAVNVGLNAWEVTIPVSAERSKRLKRGESAEDWDGAVFLMGGVESEPAVGSGEAKGSVKVTVYFLDGAPA